MPADALLDAKGIVRVFGPVRVLFGVDFSLRRGEVHARIGENGPASRLSSRSSAA